MNERQIQQVAAVLVSWNPLGSKVSQVSDLNGYRAEAIDIISTIGVFGRSKSASGIVADVLNQAFDLKLSASRRISDVRLFQFDDSFRATRVAN